MQDPISYEALLDHLKDGVCVVDSNRNISFWNHGAERITGYARTEAVGRPYTGGPLAHCDKVGAAVFPSEVPGGASLEVELTREYELYLRRKEGVTSGSSFPICVWVSAGAETNATH